MVSPVTKATNQHAMEEDKAPEKTESHSSDLKLDTNFTGAKYRNVKTSSEYNIGEELSLQLDIDWNPKKTNKWALVGKSQTYTSCNENGKSCKTTIHDTVQLQYSPGANSAIGIGLFSNRTYSADGANSSRQYYDTDPTALFGTPVGSPYESSTIIGPYFSISIDLGTHLPDTSE